MPLSKRLTVEDVNSQIAVQIGNCLRDAVLRNFVRANPSRLMLDKIRELEDVLRERLLRLRELGVPHDLAGLHVHKLQHERDRGGRRGRIVEALALTITLQHPVEDAIGGNRAPKLERIFVEVLRCGGRQISHRANDIILRYHVPSARERGLRIELRRHRIRSAIGDHIAIVAGSRNHRHHRDGVDLDLL